MDEKASWKMDYLSLTKKFNDFTVVDFCYTPTPLRG